MPIKRIFQNGHLTLSFSFQLWTPALVSIATCRYCLTTATAWSPSPALVSMGIWDFLFLEFQNQGIHGSKQPCQITKLKPLFLFRSFCTPDAHPKSSRSSWQKNFFLKKQVAALSSEAKTCRKSLIRYKSRL